MISVTKELSIDNDWSTTFFIGISITDSGGLYTASTIQRIFSGLGAKFIYKASWDKARRAQLHRIAALD